MPGPAGPGGSLFAEPSHQDRAPGIGHAEAPDRESGEEHQTTDPGVDVDAEVLMDLLGHVVGLDPGDELRDSQASSFGRQRPHHGSHELELALCVDRVGELVRASTAAEALDRAFAEPHTNGVYRLVAAGSRRLGIA